MTENLDALRNLVAAQRQLDILRLGQAFDPRVPESRPNHLQQAVLDDLGKVPHRYVRGGNQGGKSQTGGRETSWIFQENHPTWKRPAHWKGPLMLLVLSRTSTIVQEEIWEKKIRPFLPAGSYKEHRAGGQLYKVTHNKTKNTILFFSHHSPDEAREKVQAFTAHYVWMDEMPKSVKLIEELHRRIQANQGYFLATFTPKVISKEIRELVDTASSIHKVYPLNMLANPIYAGQEETILESMKTYSEAYRNTLLYGDWYVGDEAVYDFGKQHIRAPENYHPSWRHLAAVDPASSGKTGLVLLAECPTTSAWFVVKAKYLQEKVPSNLVDLVEDELRGYNVVKRVADSHESWFIGEAGKKGYRYGGVWKKNERKKELIKNLQEALHRQKTFVPGWNEDLIDEFNTCQWHETIDGKIVGASRFHLLDAYQYGVDNLPKPSTAVVPKSHDEALKLAHRERKKREAQKSKFGSFKPRGRLYASRGRKVKLS